MNIIKQRRKALRISKRTMAKLLGINTRSYSEFERDYEESVWPLCKRVCVILGVDFNEI